MSASLADLAQAFYAGALNLTPSQVAAMSLSQLQQAFYTAYPSGFAPVSGSSVYETQAHAVATYSPLANNPLGRRFKSGYYYTFDDGGADSTLAMSQDNLILPAFTVGATTTFNQVSLEVTTAGAGSTIDLAVYDSNPTDGTPHNRLFTANISGAATGIITATASLTLVPGIYWVGAVAHTATPPTVRAKGLSQSRYVGQGSGGNSNISSYAQFSLSGVPAALDPAVTPGGSGNPPKVMLRAA